MSAFTARNYPVTRAPKRITLLGDKATRPEPAQHVIEFPGGAVEVSRTTDGHYWAHIIVNATGQVLGDDGSLRESVRGRVVASRMDGPEGVRDVPGAGDCTQIAVLVAVGGAETVADALPLFQGAA